MTTDSGKYDYPSDEVQRLVLGLLTAASIDTPTAAKYWAETFPTYPGIPPEDVPSYLRLHGLVIGRLAQIIVAFRNEPVLAPGVERILEGLRDGTLFD